ncbi:MAG: hypothetical protein ABGX47_18940 [Martelella sp.]|uniref:hypothetical protein n=1 Tax=Martelella sp. TaxID=1969699 RepID=UPI003242B418
MFGLFKRRALREQAKLISQNYSASHYIAAFDPELSELARQQVESIQAIWEPSRCLPDEVLQSLLSVNRSMRSVYDGTPGRYLKSFDDEFKPVLGWNDYFEELGLK